MIDISNIVEGWYNTINKAGLSLDKQRIAEDRIKTCEECEYMRIGVFYTDCALCGCKLPQKTYSYKKSNVCPENKWKE